MGTNTTHIIFTMNILQDILKNKHDTKILKEILIELSFCIIAILTPIVFVFVSLIKLIT